jgi:hypothetical protein
MVVASQVDAAAAGREREGKGEPPETSANQIRVL